LVSGALFGANGYSGLMKVGEVLQMLQNDGWFLVSVRGSHRQFKHPLKQGRVTVPGKPAMTLRQVR